MGTNEKPGKFPESSDLARKVILAPMVRGSELAYRLLARSFDVETCFSPMLRADQVVKAYDLWEQGKAEQVTHEDGLLFLNDSCAEDSPLVVQLCGNQPPVLAQATIDVVEYYQHHFDNPVVGIDLNLGCPQSCASTGDFGAFLVERNPDLAIECVEAMRHALDKFSSVASAPTILKKTKPRLSCKIRLLESIDSTINFAKRLRNAGCESITVHCRQRHVKHNGVPDYDAGRTIVKALDIPVTINGGIESVTDITHVLDHTGAESVMIANGFLKHPDFLLQRHLGETDQMPMILQQSTKLSFPTPPHELATAYLTYAEQYPPPSPLYLQRHFRWIFRHELEPEDSNDPLAYKKEQMLAAEADISWRARLWTFLVRPYLERIHQFRQVIVFYCIKSGVNIPASLQHIPEPSFSDIRHGRTPTKAEDDDDHGSEESAVLLFG